MSVLEYEPDAPLNRGAREHRRRRDVDDVSRRSGARGWFCRRPAPALAIADVAVGCGVALLLGHGVLVGIVLGVAVAGTLALDAVRRPRLAPSAVDAVRPALTGAVIGFAATVIVTDGAAIAGSASAALVTAIGVLLLRCLAFMFLRRARRDGEGLEPTVVVGAGEVASAITRVLARRPEFGLAPVGFVDDVDDADLPLPLLGSSAALPDVVRRHGITRVVIAYGCERETDVVGVLRASADLDVDVYVLPRFFELGATADGRATGDLWGFPLVPLRRPLKRRRARWAKRTFDVVVGGALLVASVPFMAVLALLVRLSSPGPVLFRQERVGMGGRPYQLLKFRSMLPNTDSDTQWTVDGDDDRVTPIGRIMRRTHLDELPQLWNVLRGDMSLVGPRPERPFFVDRFSQDVPGYGERHRVPTGLTGLAQVNGLWGDTCIEDRARFDNLYIEQWSVARDLEILLRTVPTLLGRRDDDEVDGAPSAAGADALAGDERTAA